MVGKVEVAGPGFLNVFLAPDWCADALKEILADGSAYGTSRAGEGKRMLLEFVSANPHGATRHRQRAGGRRGRRPRAHPARPGSRGGEPVLRQ
jgi:Arginyl-tRNA synthetase